MILYNVTVGIDLDVEKEWVTWMLNIHIPEVMATGKFESFDMYKVLSHEGDGASYSIQYMASSMDLVQDYLDNHAPGLIKVHMERYKDKHVAFRSLLEKVS